MTHRAIGIISATAVLLAGGVGYWIGRGHGLTCADVPQHAPPVSPSPLIPASSSPVEFLPVEGLLYAIRRLTDPGQTDRWDGTGYEFLSLGPYVLEWYWRARTKTIRLGGWRFRVSGDPEPEYKDGWVNVGAASTIEGSASDSGGATRRVIKVHLLARREGSK